MKYLEKRQANENSLGGYIIPEDHLIGQTCVGCPDGAWS